MDLAQSYLLEIEHEHYGEEPVTKHTGDTGDKQETTVWCQFTDHLGSFRNTMFCFMAMSSDRGSLGRLTAPGHFRIGLREFIAKLPEKKFMLFFPG